MMIKEMLAKALEMICFIMVAIMFGCGVLIPACKIIGVGYVVIDMLLVILAAAILGAFFSFLSVIALEV